MSLRKTGKLLLLVGFAICLTCLGVLYGNLASTVEERDNLAAKKLELKRDSDLKAQTIATLQSKLVKAQGDIQSCKAIKETQEKKYNELMKTLESTKAELEKQYHEVMSMQEGKETETKQLRATIDELNQSLAKSKQTVSSLEHLSSANEECQASVEALQTQLGLARADASSLEAQLANCKSANQESADDEHDSEDEESNLIPVAAVPKAADRAPVVGGAEQAAPVAALPNQQLPLQPAVHQQEIPGAQAPAPGAVVEAPLAPANNQNAIAPAPVQPAPNAQVIEEPRHERSIDGEKEEKVEIVEGEISDKMLEPLQPMNDDLLADAVAKVQQAEQLQVLQDRQQQMQPHADDDANDVPELQAARPAPDMGEEEREEEREQEEEREEEEDEREEDREDGSFGSFDIPARPDPHEI